MFASLNVGVDNSFMSVTPQASGLPVGSASIIIDEIESKRLSYIFSTDIK